MCSFTSHRVIKIDLYNVITKMFPSRYRFLLLLVFSVNLIYGQVIHYRLHEIPQDYQGEDTTDLYAPFGTSGKVAKAILEGIHFTSKDKSFLIGNTGFWTTIPEYNFVDGFWLGQTLESSYRFNRKHRLELEAKLYYTTARKKFTWETEVSYFYAPQLVGKLKLHAGNRTADYDTEEHLARLENSLYALFLGQTFMKLYLQKFVKLQNSFYPVQGLRVHKSLGLHRRQMVDINTQFSFFDSKKNQTNTPNNLYFKPMPTHLALIGSLGFDYTLCYSCMRASQLYNEIIYSYIPTLSARIVFGIPVGTANRSSFQFVEASINQRFKFRMRNTFDYKIGGGGFLSKHNLQFPDFRHFGAYTLPSMRTFADDGFFLIGYYKADTDKHWIKASGNFVSQQFLLTRFKWLAQNGFNEGLHARYLYTPNLKHYTEWGYALGYKTFARVGLFVGFNGGRYESIGATLSLTWLSSVY